MADRSPDPRPRADDVEDYADGEIGVRHGGVNWWLRVLYAGLAIWAVYYLVAYWGGLGPGLAPGQ